MTERFLELKDVPGVQMLTYISLLMGQPCLCGQMSAALVLLASPPVICIGSGSSRALCVLLLLAVVSLH